MSKYYSVQELNEPLINFEDVRRVLKTAIFSPVKTIVVHDNDPDGWCAAHILLQLYIQNKAGNQIELVPVGHGHPFQNYPIETLPEGEVLVILDHMVTDELAKKYSERYTSIVIIDHHQGTCQSQKKLAVIHSLRYSTTGLMFRLYDALSKEAPYQHQISSKMKTVAKMINYYDSWLFEKDTNDPVTIEFESEVRSLISYLFTMGVKQFQWKLCFDSSVDYIKERYLAEIISKGSEILELNKVQVETICQKKVRLCNMYVNGKQFSVALVLHSNLMDDIGSALMVRFQDQIDFAVVISLGKEDDFFALSLRSDNQHIDVGEIAKALGGGGHRNSAGCRLSLDAFHQVFSKGAW